MSLLVDQVNFLVDQVNVLVDQVTVLVDQVSHLSQTSKSFFCHLPRIGSFRKYLSTEATEKLVTSLIPLLQLSLSGLPASSVHNLHRIQNYEAHFILKKKKKKKKKMKKKKKRKKKKKKKK